MENRYLSCVHTKYFVKLSVIHRACACHLS